jgi:competence protein ComEA
MYKRTRVLVPFLALIAIVVGLSTNVQAKKGSQLVGVVNVNSASAEELEMLPGIGASKAAAVVSFRETEKFTTTDDLVKVKGIGGKLLQNIQAYITVDGPTTAKLIKDVSLGLDTSMEGEQG